MISDLFALLLIFSQLMIVCTLQTYMNTANAVYGLIGAATLMFILGKSNDDRYIDLITAHALTSVV